MTIDNRPTDSIIFSADFPDLEISTDSSRVDLSVKRGDVELFSTQLRAYAGKVTAYDLRSIIEDDLRSTGAQMGAYVVELSAESETSIAATFLVCYSEYTSGTSALDWLNAHFMTRLAARRVHVGDPCPLYYLHRTSNDRLVRHQITLRFAEGVRTITLIRQDPQVDNVPAIVSIEAGHAAVAALIEGSDWTDQLHGEISDPTDYDILSWTITVGDRSCSFYVEGGEADKTLRFRNRFNALEVVSIKAATAAKSDMTRSEAICAGKTRGYDYQLEHSFEVETGPLWPEEGEWLREMTMSRSVELLEGGAWIPVYIESGEVSVSDDDTADTTVKFTYSYSDGRLRAPLPDVPGGEFTSPFDQTFS